MMMRGDSKPLFGCGEGSRMPGLGEGILLVGFAGGFEEYLIAPP